MRKTDLINVRSHALKLASNFVESFFVWDWDFWKQHIGFREAIIYDVLSDWLTKEGNTQPEILKDLFECLVPGSMITSPVFIASIGKGKLQMVQAHIPFGFSHHELWADVMLAPGASTPRVFTFEQFSSFNLQLVMLSRRLRRGFH